MAWQHYDYRALYNVRRRIDPYSCRQTWGWAIRERQILARRLHAQFDSSNFSCCWRSWRGRNPSLLERASASVVCACCTSPLAVSWTVKRCARSQRRREPWRPRGEKRARAWSRIHKSAIKCSCLHQRRGRGCLGKSTLKLTLLSPKRDWPMLAPYHAALKLRDSLNANNW